MASLVITTEKSLPVTFECLADHLSSPILSGGNVGHHKPESPTVVLQLAADRYFTLIGFYYALRSLCSKGTPGPDEINNQALQNLDAVIMPSLLNMFNAIRTSSKILSYYGAKSR